MNWITDHFQIVIAIVGGVVYFWNQFRQAKNEEREAKRRNEENGPTSYDSGPVEYEQPVAPQLPPRLPPRRDFSEPPPVYQPVSGPVIQARTINANARELERQANLQERLRALRESKAKTSGGAAATQASRKKKPVAVVVPVRSTGLRQRLRDRREVRQAIIMREILGPPVGLK